MSIDSRLRLLRQLLKRGLCTTTGFHPVKAEDLVLYYDVDEKLTNRINLGHATEEDLSKLLACCHPSDVKPARTLDTTKFATRLDVVASGLLDAIATDVLQGDNADESKSLEAELTRMDVYGIGTSAHTHSNALQGNSMVGFLVVIFPTAHTGGQVKFEHSSRRDPASELVTAYGPDPSAIWSMASYGNVSHVVESIISGHRVALMYNLQTEEILEGVLRTLLADPAFLPLGGFLAAGLAHTYAMPPPVRDVVDPTAHWVNNKYIPSSMAEKRWGTVLRALRGSDARLRAVSERAGLSLFVRLLYARKDCSHESIRDVDILVEDIPDLWGVYEVQVAD
ncbi:hypothetical protein DFH06DRAFT_1372025 [Mycena polygramma]|nr:hypothetical protein DFH06DRAFT_1372025 [Mycena polygramma]